MNFLQRQLSPEITERQFKFDVVFGIFAPILCIAIDLSRLNGLIVNSPAFSYGAIIASIVGLTVWLLFNSQIQALWSGLITGVLLSGAVYASVLAFFVAAFAVWGFAVSMMLAGFNVEIMGLFVLGFLPIISALVFIRNGFRAFKFSLVKISKSRLIALVLLSSIVMFFITMFTLAQ